MQAYMHVLRMVNFTTTTNVVKSFQGFCFSLRQILFEINSGSMYKTTPELFVPEVLVK